MPFLIPTGAMVVRARYHRTRRASIRALRTVIVEVAHQGGAGRKECLSVDGPREASRLRALTGAWRRALDTCFRVPTLRYHCGRGAGVVAGLWTRPRIFAPGGAGCVVAVCK